MSKLTYILFLVFFGCFVASAQVSEKIRTVKINGSVQGKENRMPISGVAVSTDKGAYTLTDSQGDYKITAEIGDVLTFESPEFETKRYTIKSDEDVDVWVEGFTVSNSSRRSSKLFKRSASSHQSYLDSANFYKKKDIEKSIDFITKSIAQLGKGANKKELASSLTTLGEVYQYYKQYDLAITNLEDALEANKSTKTTLLLGTVYLLNHDYENARKVLTPLVKVKNMVPFQQVQLYENLGDTYKGLGQINKAVAYYEQGLVVANKNQITPKMTDLNSKIADSYANADRGVEAEGFYGNSLKLAEHEAPQRAIQEKEKVADFYNKKNRYNEEIEMRKRSLDQLKNLPTPVVENKFSYVVGADSITSQRINYKIGNAYIAQDKYEQAIPYLEKSIVEAGVDDDLIVQKDATRKLSEVYRYKGDYSKALETLKDYVALVDTLYIRKEQEISRAARFGRELSTKQSRISGLEQERELSQSKYDLALTEQELVQENSKRQQWVIYSLIFGLVLMALTTFFFYRSNQQQKLANNLLALKSLRSQMNPHFIFNALNSVNNYISKNDERNANRFLSEFSTLMRAVLENSEEDFIPLSKELELLELYVKLEHSRFPDKFDYKIDIEKHIDISSFEIPPMLLQPYIENAIWHGLRYKEEKGFLNIDLRQKDKKTIVVTITDNGVGRTKSAEFKTLNQKKQKSKGMGNIRKRIAILNEMYKDKVVVHILDLEQDGTGTKVVFTLKKD